MILHPNEQVECIKCGNYFALKSDDIFDGCRQYENSAFANWKWLRIVEIAMETTINANV